MENGVLTAILAVFTALFDWIIDALTSVISLFWATGTGLTFFGVLAIVALGISIFFLLVRVVQNFLHFRS